MIITFQNVEKVVFQNYKLKEKLPDYNNLFRTYAFASQHSDLRPISQKSLIDFVNSFKEEHLHILKEHFQEEVEVKKVDLNVAHHYEFQIDEMEKELNKMHILKDFYFAYREGDKVYLSVWR